jgi:hypothetical protein
MKRQFVENWGKSHETTRIRLTSVQISLAGSRSPAFRRDYWRGYQTSPPDFPEK